MISIMKAVSGALGVVRGGGEVVQLDAQGGEADDVEGGFGEYV